MRFASQQLIHPRPLMPWEADQQRDAASTVISPTPIAAGNPANTDGSWETLIASTTIEATEIRMGFAANTGVSGQDRSILMDIAIGPDSSPTIIIEDVQVGYILLQGTVPVFTFPIRVPAGSELIARTRSAVADAVVNVAVSLFGGGHTPYFTECVTYGAVPATSRGTALAVPGATHTKGAWTEFSAAVARPIYGIGFGYGGLWQPQFSNANFFVDIGVGPAATERVVVPDLYFQTFSSETLGVEMPPNRYAPLLEPIGVGQRLVARYQTNLLAQGINLILYGYS